MIDEFTKYLLDQIEIFRKDAKEEPSEKDGCEYAAGALLQALVKYQSSISIQA
jgi:hypothetical protein